MDTTRKHDWGLIVAGILLVLCAFFFVVAPGLTLVTITGHRGRGVPRVRHIRHHQLRALPQGHEPVGVGHRLRRARHRHRLMFLIHPLAFAGVIPWVIGAFFIIFGAFEVVGSFRIRKTGVPMWGWMLFSGIVSVLCGITFFVAPASFSIFLSVFILMRGVSLVFYGWNANKGMLA